MYNFLIKLERKFARYSIRNLTNIMMVIYAISYIIEIATPELMPYLYFNLYDIIYHYQFWRIISWVLLPPEALDIFIIFMFLFYWHAGNSLERSWGAFRYNVFIFSGIIFMMIGAILLYFIAPHVYPEIFEVSKEYGYEVIYTSHHVSTSYVNFSLFLAYAITYPELEIYFMMLIPIKMKYIGFAYGTYILYSLFKADDLMYRVYTVMTLLNVILLVVVSRRFFLTTPEESRRRYVFKKEIREGMKGKYKPKKVDGSNVVSMATGKGLARHRCVVCGRTELDDPNLEFRFCSQCDGEYEYCMEHLHNHVHIKNNPVASSEEGDSKETKTAESSQSDNNS